MKEIEKIRNVIDLIDDKLIELINKRVDLSSQLLSYKIMKNISINDLKREKEILEKIRKKNPKLEHIFKEIFKTIKFHFLPDAKLDDLLKYRPVIIAGPCAIESKKQIDSIAKELYDLGVRILRGGTFKPRTSPDDFQGLESVGVNYLKSTAQKYGMYSVTEFLDKEQLDKHYDDVDIIQIGSRNMMNYAYLKDVGKKTGSDKKPVILKRGYSSTLKEYLNAAKYITNYGNNNILLTLRGIRTFEQMDSKFRNTPDLASIIELRSMTNLPVLFDPSHATGDRKFVVDVSKAALSLGADGIIVETHIDPDKALIDGKQSILPKDLKNIFDWL